MNEEEELLSTCCGGYPASSVDDDNEGICSSCKEWAEFVMEEDYIDEDAIEQAEWDRDQTYKDALIKYKDRV